MKKNNVAVDFINFGEETENTEKLEKFREGVNSNDNSHVVTIPPGPYLLSDKLTSIFIDGDFGGEEPASTGFDQFDPQMDPELALALRMSLEDEKARQEKVKREKEQAEKAEKEKTEKEDGSSSSVAAEASSSTGASSKSADKEETPKSDSKKDKDGDDLMEM